VRRLTLPLWTIGKSQIVSEKTNAMRLLDAAGIPYQLYSYPLDEDDISAEQVAALLEVAPERIFKTLIALGDRTGPMLVLAPARTEIDLRALARHSGDKRVELAPQREVLGLAGHERGAVTPLGIARSYPVYIEETAILWDTIGISAGAKGLELMLAPGDLIKITSAKLVDIARSVV
jgi:Cys-tRNA(Pro)/Cys-tRNA(Cys) deacylase